MHDPQTRERLIAQGWKPRDLPGFIGMAGPLWTRREACGWEYGLLAEGKHLNPAGVVHGGALATLVDHVISTVAWEAAGRAACLTLQLDTLFLDAARDCDFLVATAEVTHRTAGMIFARGEVTVNGKPALQAQAVLKVLRPRSAPAVD
jgi:uncharacterized protein (TIGR00369 family)